MIAVVDDDMLELTAMSIDFISACSPCVLSPTVHLKITMKLSWTLCLAALIASVVVSEDPNLSANGDDFIMVAPGSLFLNGKNVGEYLDKVDDLVAQVARVMLENKDLKVSALLRFERSYGSGSIDGKRSAARLAGNRFVPTGGLWLWRSVFSPDPSADHRCRAGCSPRYA
jgi:hypothetical protein